MPKRFIKRYLPDHHKIKEHRHLKIFGRLLHDPNLWHLNRRSVPGAFTVGLLAAFIPLPLQMALAAAGAILFRVNLPIAVALTWLTNPLTMPPVFYASYKIGTWLLPLPADAPPFEASADWLMKELEIIWEPFFLGLFLLATACAVAANVAIRLLWRLHILRHIKQRRQRRQRDAQKTHRPDAASPAPGDASADLADETALKPRETNTAPPHS